MLHWLLWKAWGTNISINLKYLYFLETKNKSKNVGRKILGKETCHGLWGMDLLFWRKPLNLLSHLVEWVLKFLVRSPLKKKKTLVGMTENTICKDGRILILIGNGKESCFRRVYGSGILSLLRFPILYSRSKMKYNYKLCRAHRTEMNSELIF